jgi:tetratricopeptide (TPR) repeat protein
VARAGIDPASCAVAVSHPRELPVAPPELITRVAELRVAGAAGDAPRVMELGPPLAREVDATGDLELVVDVYATIAHASRASSTDAVRDATRHAAEAASGIGDDVRAAEMWALAATVALEGGETRTAEDMIAMARAAARRSGSDEARRLVTTAEGQLALANFEIDRAISTCQGVLDEAGAGWGPVQASAYDCLADAVIRGRRWEELEAATLRHEPEQIAALGADHPEVLLTRHRRAMAIFMRGDRPAARALWEEVRVGLETIYGADSMPLLRHYQDLTSFESARGNANTPEGRAAAERVIEIATRILPPDDFVLAAAKWAYANLLGFGPDFDRAAAIYDEAIAIYETRDDHEALARLLLSAADTDRAARRCDRARSRFDRVVALSRTATLSGTVVGIARAGIAACLAEAGEHDRAVAELTEAAAMVAAAGEPVFAADIELHAAEIELGRGRKAAARKLAASARARVGGPGLQEEELRARADAILK